MALKKDGGKIDGISGATFASFGVTNAVNKGMKFYLENKETILKSIK